MLLRKVLQFSSNSHVFDAHDSQVKVGPPASGTEGYMNEALPQYDGEHAFLRSCNVQLTICRLRPR